jgi:predicted nucleic-acid-binding protein
MRATTLVRRELCYVTDVVTTEIVFVLEKVYKMSRSDIASLLRGFLAFPNLAYNDQLLDRVIELFEQQHALSIIDCYAAAEAERSGTDLITFDKKLWRCGPHVRQP